MFVKISLNVLVMLCLSCCSNFHQIFVQSAIQRLLLVSFGILSDFLQVKHEHWYIEYVVESTFIDYWINRKLFGDSFFSKWVAVCLDDVKWFTMMLSFSAVLSFFSSIPVNDDCFSSMLLNSYCFYEKQTARLILASSVEVKLKYFCWRHFYVLTGLMFVR